MCWGKFQIVRAVWSYAMVRMPNEIRQGRDASDRYKELQRAEAWAEWILCRKQLYWVQQRRSVPDSEYDTHRSIYERHWETEWNALERKLLNGSGVPAMVRRQLGENADVKRFVPSRAMQTPMPEYVGKKLPTIEELEKEYLGLQYYLEKKKKDEEE